jgi:hypothetical protein
MMAIRKSTSSMSIGISALPPPPPHPTMSFPYASPMFPAGGCGGSGGSSAPPSPMLSGRLAALTRSVSQFSVL